MNLDHPGIKEFAYIQHAIFYSTDEAAVNDAWQTCIFTVPVGHKELPMLHQAAKTRQTELRDAAAKEKARLEREKNNPLITKDTSRYDNELPRFSKK